MSLSFPCPSFPSVFQTSFRLRLASPAPSFLLLPPRLSPSPVLWYPSPADESFFWGNGEIICGSENKRESSPWAQWNGFFRGGWKVLTGCHVWWVKIIKILWWGIFVLHLGGVGLDVSNCRSSFKKAPCAIHYGSLIDCRFLKAPHRSPCSLELINGLLLSWLKRPPTYSHHIHWVKKDE